MRRLMAKTPDASLSDSAVSFTYNDLGQRATMTDASGVTNYVYDSRNRLASKQTPEGNLNYTYDEAGGIKTVRSNHTGGVSVDYSYDELNRLSSVKDNRLVGNQTTAYTYDAVGNLQSYSYPNQVTTSYAYNNLNRLTTLTVSNATNGLASYAYTLGAAGNRTQVVEGNGRTVNYAYDDLYRLTSETIANSANNGVVSYGYDAVGNRLNRSSSVAQVPNQSSTFDANDRLNSDTFDNNGSTKISNGKSYNYDFENKLTSTSDGVQIVYDGDGNRVSKTVGGVTTKYLVDTNNLTNYAQVVEEIQNNQVVKSYTYGLDLISQKTGAIVSFYNYDGHGSVRSLTNSAAQITDTYDYDAFGTLINRTGVTDNNYLYAGEQFDADLGFYYNRARYLNVATGRFISQDNYEGSSDDPLSLHKYLYAYNDAINKNDPSGYSFDLASLNTSLVVYAIVATIAVAGLLLLRDESVRNATSSAWEAVREKLKEKTKSPQTEPEPKKNPVPIPIPIPRNEDNEANAMRVQLQESPYPSNGTTLNTHGVARMNSSRIGVTVLQMRDALNEIYNDIRNGDVNWFPYNALENWYFTATIEISQKLGEVKESGGVTGLQRSFITRSVIHNRKEYRIDVDNLRGHNLRN
jgi:RHS repeat-associated protein